jgi:hypothetical protein
MDRLEEHAVAQQVRSHYTDVGEICGRTVYLLRGTTRPPLATGGECGGTVLP